MEIVELHLRDRGDRRADFFADRSHYVFAGVHEWGWITLLLGVLELAAGSLVLGSAFGRIFAILAASLGAVGALLAVGGAYPFWSLGVFAICVICIRGLVVYGEDDGLTRP